MPATVIPVGEGGNGGKGEREYNNEGKTSNRVGGGGKRCEIVTVDRPFSSHCSFGKSAVKGGPSNDLDDLDTCCRGSEFNALRTF